MSTLTHFTTIEDAYYYFFQAKSSPDTSQGFSVKQRHLRTAVLLGWVAVDDAVAAFARSKGPSWQQRFKGIRLFQRLQFIWGELHRPLDEAEFKGHRSIRNALTHPNGVFDTSLTVEQVDETLAYCKKSIKVMFPHLVVGEEWKGRLSESPLPARPNG
jgi:hypothetical protein